jgi:hypothetical protein
MRGKHDILIPFTLAPTYGRARGRLETRVGDILWDNAALLHRFD